MLYINKSSRDPFWAMEYSRDEALRKYWDEYSPPFHKDGDGPLYNGQNAAEYNRNQDSHAIEDVVRWYDYWEARPGTGKRVSSGGVNIIFSDSNTHHRGAENYRRSGEVDALRLPKDGYFANQEMWDGWVDVEKPSTHIIGHWNYAPGTRKNVYVVSTAEKVELFVNGKSLGFGTRSSNFLFTFTDVEWQPGKITAIGFDKDGNQLVETEPGEIRAVGYDKDGQAIAADSIKTAAPPFAIKLTPRTAPGGLKADGADIAIIDVEVVDKQGRRCPTALNTINFMITGQAEWRGGLAQGPDNYILSKNLPVENGVNRILIRSTRVAGKITLKAESPGLASAEISIDSRPFGVKDGLANSFPSDGLPPNLERGPTPPGESFAVSRRSIAVASVTAGSNEQAAVNTIDDNETTEWKSDGKTGTAWIRFELADRSEIDEICLKLVGWRTQSYPIKVSVDDNVVFTGATSRSLGYVTIGFPRITGKSVKIELTGDATNRDAFGNIIEIPGTPDAQSSAGRGGAKNTLGIVEAEVYSTIPR